MPDKAFYHFIEKGLKTLGYNPSTALIEFFIFYTHELNRWNKVHNLTSITEEEDIAVKHFFDSLLYLKVIDTRIDRLVDIGTGAGFPGIPIKAVQPGIHVTLVEPQTKKCLFLRHLLRQSEILTDCEIINKRVEDIHLDAQFDVAVTRALFSLKEFAEKSARLIKPDGSMVVSKGPGVDEELKDIHNYKLFNLKLPFTDIERRLVVMKKEVSPSL